jgi:hypothetical protein
MHRWRVRPTSPLAAVDGVVRAVLVDHGTEAGRAKFESHYDSTAPLLRLRLTFAPLFALDMLQCNDSSEAVR